ncbi:MAG: pyridoxal phosphate-dependent aminotransferase [Lewinella sp.]|nr:pyridoxal phosphate-dependent aminotransferase [Lewinella sp.]
MPTVSHRSQTVPLSPFRKLIPVADEAKARGVHVYHLNIGQPDIHTPASAIEKLQQTKLDILAYSAAEGNLSYRKALIDYYARFDLALEPRDIVVTTGGSEAILFFMLACMDPGDEIIIPEPFYANYNGFAHIADVRVIPITCQIENGFALPPPEAFAEKITPRTKAIFITNPNNPTGCRYSDNALEVLARIVREHDLFLCVDEVYREFCYDEEPFTSALHLPGLEEHAVVIDSVSKRYSACGARVGAMVTRNRGVVESVVRYAKLRLSPPGLGQILSEAMLQDDTDYLSGVKEEYERRRDLVARRLAAIPGVVSYVPGGAFYCFARFPVQSSEDFCRWLLEDFSHEGKTVMLSPGQGFYATPGLGRDEVRIAYVLNETDLNGAMDCLEAALAVYPGRITLLEEAEMPR